jgi:hypothetical protein
MSELPAQRSEHGGDSPGSSSSGELGFDDVLRVSNIS